jgi:methyltransferase (TIGR00027 family)
MKGLPEVKNVSGTAFVVAEFRAEENHEENPLYQDSIVSLFLNRDTKKAAMSVAASFPPAKDLVKTRTKYFDETLERQILEGYHQIVLLGAGLDTRAVRKAASSVVFFEIDDEATMRFKKARYEEQGIQANVRFIPGNYVTDDLISLLKTNGFNFELPTYLIWEGNTMYLPLEVTKQTISQIRKHLKQFRLSFDYMADAVISKTTGDPGITSLVEAFSNMGAPWMSGIEDVEALAFEMNLTVLENFRMAELRQTYYPGRRLASPIFNFYSLCTLGSEQPTRPRGTVN